MGANREETHFPLSQLLSRLEVLEAPGDQGCRQMFRSQPAQLLHCCQLTPPPYASECSTMTATIRGLSAAGLSATCQEPVDLNTNSGRTRLPVFRAPCKLITEAPGPVCCRPLSCWQSQLYAERDPEPRGQRAGANCTPSSLAEGMPFFLFHCFFGVQLPREYAELQPHVHRLPLQASLLLASRERLWHCPHPQQTSILQGTCFHPSAQGNPASLFLPPLFPPCWLWWEALHSLPWGNLTLIISVQCHRAWHSMHKS